MISWDIFDFSSESSEQNSTKLDMKQDFNVLYQVCVFRAVCVFGPIGKTRWPPGLWFAETFSNYSLKLLNRIRRNLTGSKILTSYTSLCFFGPIRKTRLPQPPLIGWNMFNFTSKIQRNLTGSKISTSSAKFVFLGSIGRNKMAAPTPGWLRHFRLLLWNYWTELNETWQVARSQLTSSTKFMFFGPTGKTR